MPDVTKSLDLSSQSRDKMSSPAQSDKLTQTLSRIDDLEQRIGQLIRNQDKQHQMLIKISQALGVSSDDAAVASKGDQAPQSQMALATTNTREPWIRYLIKNEGLAVTDIRGQKDTILFVATNEGLFYHQYLIMYVNTKSVAHCIRMIERNYSRAAVVHRIGHLGDAHLVYKEIMKAIHNLVVIDGFHFTPKSAMNTGTIVNLVASTCYRYRSLEC